MANLTVPEIKTLAKPTTHNLLAARERIQNQGSFRDIFAKAKNNRWGTHTLSEALQASDIDPETANYLAEEYNQLGEGLYVVSTETGQVTTVIHEEDFYTPAPVPREGSTELVQLPPTLRPDIKGAMVMMVHDHEREARILTALAKRGHQTDLLKVMGDPRLLVATKKGRKQIVVSLTKEDPKELLKAAGGTTGTFLRHFTIIGEDEEAPTSCKYFKGILSTKSVMGVHDPLTTNLSHNRVATLKGALVQGWVRGMAHTLAKEATAEPVKVDISQVKGISGFWIAPSYLVRPLKMANSKIEVLPVDGLEFPIVLSQEKMGVIRLPKIFEAFSAERFDRWETSANLDYEIWTDAPIQRYIVEGVDATPQVFLMT